MPFLLAEILNFQGSAHLFGVGSLRFLYILTKVSVSRKSKSTKKGCSDYQVLNR